MDQKPPVVGTLSTMGDHQQLTTTRLLAHAARTVADQTIDHKMADGSWKTRTYGQLWDRVRRTAAGLRDLGVQPGDHVGVLMWNDIRHLESYFSIPLLGATMVQLNLRLAPADLLYVINHAKVKMILVDESLLDLARVLSPRLGESFRWIVCSDTDPTAGQNIDAEVVDYETLVREHEPIKSIPDIDERTASGACYTTGTTGHPKGVLYSHRSTWLHSFAVISGLGMTMADTVMCLTPMFHAQCWGFPYAAVASGARLVLPGRFSLADTPALTDAIVDRGVTIAPAAPAILLPMLHHLETMPTSPRLDGVRLLCGASEPPVSMMKGFDAICGAEVIHAYGATETSPVVALNRLKPHLKQNLDEASRWELKRFQGLVVVGVDLKIVDPLGTPLPPGEENIGEICVRGPWITASYSDNAAASESGFDAEGYWRSGDIGYLSHEGYLKVTDRMKDVIKSGGEWISSIDMENRIMGVSGVQDAAVLGVPHPKWQERPLALVVVAPEATVTESQVREALSQSFATWQLPDQILFVEDIAHTSVGKINKKRLREDYAERYLSSGSH